MKQNRDSRRLPRSDVGEIYLRPPVACRAGIDHLCQQRRGMQLWGDPDLGEIEIGQPRPAAFRLVLGISSVTVSALSVG